MKNKLWILRPIKKGEGPWEPWYDKAFGFIINAKDEEEARTVAASHCGDEGGEPWLDSDLSTCSELMATKDALMIMCDYHSA